MSQQKQSRQIASDAQDEAVAPARKGIAITARAVIYAHLATIGISLLVGQFNSIFSNRFLEATIVLPLISTIIIFPLVMAVVLAWTPDVMARIRAVMAELLLCGIQIVMWLPSIQ